MARTKRTTEPVPVAVVYRRVSTQEQADSRLGLEGQEATCREYAARHGLTVAEVHTDGAVSRAADLTDSPALMAALAALPHGGVLLVAKRDRLGSDPVRLAMAERIVERKGGRILSAAGEGTDMSGPSGFLVRGMFDLLAEYERLLIGARTSVALQAKRSRLERLGTTPLGFTTDAEGRVTADPEGQETVARARELRQAGLTLQSIADRLHHEGRRTGRGGRWRTETVRRLLAVRYLERVMAHQNANGAVRGDNAAA